MPDAPTRIALVTGAGTGVGRAAVKSLLGAGFIAVLAGRRLDVLQTAARALDEGGTRTLAVTADVAEPAQVEHLFATVAARYGRLDLLFNNAGVGIPAMPLEDLSVEAWRRVVDVNLTGTFLCTQAAFRLMKAQDPRGGRIINNGSISAHAPRPDSAPYTASKHAVTGLTRSTSLDGRKYDIACGQIDIGNADTEIAAKMKQGAMQADGRIAAEAMMAPDDVGRAIAFMATLPLDANVQFMTVMATKMPFVGRG